MNVKQSLILAFKSLMSSKMRSFLTMLGIIIGVATVIILVSLMDGMTRSMVETFENMGTNLLTVNITGRGSNKSVDVDQIQELCDENTDTIAAMSPQVTTANVTAKSDDNNLSTTIYAVNELYSNISNVQLTDGRFISFVDCENNLKSCVIGSYIKNELFSGRDPVGEEIRLNSVSYTIVGVAAEKASSEEGGQDDRIYIPYTTARYVSPFNFAGTYVISAVDGDTINEAQKVIENYLYSIFSSDDFYSISNQAEQVDSVNDLTGTMSALLVGIAALSLLVGGIGIMNIMLVSVTERTREIGIRKSLGARPWDIMGQFVVEAATTSSVGGILGIILGVAASYLGGALLDMTIVPSFKAILVAFGVSAGIGICFGYFPAKKAASLNPIDALRYD